MRLLKRSAEAWIFHLGEREKCLLREVLRFHPVLKTSFQPLSKSANPASLKADQRLLEEALASQKEENARILQAIFGDEKCFQKSGPGWRLTLTGQQIEILLQVLNDIRVGSWENLGCPETEQEPELGMTEARLRNLFAMDASSHFQAGLLRALDHDPPTL